MNLNYKMGFIFTISTYMRALIICVVLSLRAEALPIQWALLELNILCFIPILSAFRTSRSTVNRIKYFTTQRSASLLFIIAVRAPFNTSVIFVALIIFKMAIPPFQRWITSILPSLSLRQINILFTLQKLIPLIVLAQNTYPPIIFAFIFTAFRFTLISSWDSLPLWKLLFLSSVVNIMWTLGNLNNSWLIFFLGYSVILTGLLSNLKLFKVRKLSDVAKLKRGIRITLPLQFFSLGGVPPIAGFIIKLIIISKIVTSNLTIAIILLISSLVIIFMYTIVFYQVYCIKPILEKAKRSSRITSLTGNTPLIVTNFIASVFIPLLFI